EAVLSVVVGDGTSAVITWPRSSFICPADAEVDERCRELGARFQGPTAWRARSTWSRSHSRARAISSRLRQRGCSPRHAPPWRRRSRIGGQGRLSLRRPRPPVV